MMVSTDKRNLIIYHRNSFESEWEEVYRMVSPHEDIYYTAMDCIPMNPLTPASSQDILLFLAGTDNKLAVMNFNLSKKSVQSVCTLTVCISKILLCVLPSCTFEKYNRHPRIINTPSIMFLIYC